jgi:tRNA pseudouridine55 synthase
MARKRAGCDVHGVILLDKPAGLTSNRALQQVRRLLDARKAGHTGSLDPFATGMLPVCLGEACKTAAFMLDADKTYRAIVHLGQSTDTGDPEGRVRETAPVPQLDAAAIERVFERFRGPITQLPPMYSALKHRGQPLYRLARQGLEVDRTPREVTIHRLDLLDWDAPRLTFEVACSKGTYVRTLAEDISRGLGTCGHLVMLRRLAVAPFEESGMVTFEALRGAAAEGVEPEWLLPADAGLARWPVVRLKSDAAQRFRNGNPVPVAAGPGFVRVHGDHRLILGLGETGTDGQLHPRRVFVYAADGSGNA